MTSPSSADGAQDCPSAWREDRHQSPTQKLLFIERPGSKHKQATFDILTIEQTQPWAPKCRTSTQQNEARAPRYRCIEQKTKPITPGAGICLRRTQEYTANLFEGHCNKYKFLIKISVPLVLSSVCAATQAHICHVYHGHRLNTRYATHNNPTYLGTHSNCEVEGVGR